MPVLAEGGHFDWPMIPLSKLITPYGGELIDLTVPDDQTPALRDRASSFPALQLSERAACDLELLATGAFSPLDRFMGRDDFESSVHAMRLADGTVFPIPVSLPVSKAANIKLDSEIALRNSQNHLLGVMTVEEIYEWNRSDFSHAVLGTSDTRHPLNAEMLRWGHVNISGRLQVLSLPQHLDSSDLRLTPMQTRSRLSQFGNPNVVAFQTRNPLHRGHEEVCRNAMLEADASLLLHPAVGMTCPGDIDAATRIRSYRIVNERYFARNASLLALIPLAMRMAGPREAVWHMIIRRNYGANHFVIGRDHASPGADSNGSPFYDAAAAQEMAMRSSEDVGVKPLIYDEMVYLPDEDRYVEISSIEKGRSYFSLSGSALRDDYLRSGKKIPEWFMRPEISEILESRFHAGQNVGACIWLTGLSGAGKSTIAEILTGLLNENGRNVTLLDGDIVRTHLSKGLGFSREDRDINILRIGFVASEVVRHGGLAVCAAVSPYSATRGEVRNMVGQQKFIEVFVDAPIAVCEQRDVKGMYKKARSGEIKNFTGVDDPYEPPVYAEIVLDSVRHSPQENALLILKYLAERGIVSINSGSPDHSEFLNV